MAEGLLIAGNPIAARTHGSLIFDRAFRRRTACRAILSSRGAESQADVSRHAAASTRGDAAVGTSGAVVTGRVAT